MQYVRYPRAAITVTAAGRQANTPPRKRNPQDSTAPQVLWASLALPTRNGGRLVGVRRQSSAEVEVAWLEPGRAGIQWVPARLVLTDEEARRWLKVARFSR